MEKEEVAGVAGLQMWQEEEEGVVWLEREEGWAGVGWS